MYVRAQPRRKESEKIAKEHSHTSLLKKKKKKKRSLGGSNAHPELKTAKTYRRDTFQTRTLVKWLKFSTQDPSQQET